jgi:hypothetical protein
VSSPNVTHVVDKGRGRGRGLVVHEKTELCEAESGRALATLESSVYCRREGGRFDTNPSAAASRDKRASQHPSVPAMPQTPAIMAHDIVASDNYLERRVASRRNVPRRLVVVPAPYLQ